MKVQAEGDVVIVAATREQLSRGEIQIEIAGDAVIVIMTRGQAIDLELILEQFTAQRMTDRAKFAQAFIAAFDAAVDATAKPRRGRKRKPTA